MENIDLYSLYKYFHLVFMTTWMAGLFYLPRLFVYHSMAKIESREYETFIIMEKKLLRFIMNPSMIFTWIFGLLLVVHQEIYNEDDFESGNLDQFVGKLVSTSSDSTSSLNHIEL